MQSRFEYCAEAEPRLLELRVRVLAGEVSRSDGEDELHKLVGRRRYFNDWDAAQKGRVAPKGRDAGLYALECWENSIAKDDLRWRVYGTPQSDMVFDDLRDELWPPEPK